MSAPAYEDLPIPLGTVTKDADGEHWTHIGTRIHSGTPEWWFENASVQDGRVPDLWHGSDIAVVIEKFPELAQFRGFVASPDFMEGEPF